MKETNRTRKITRKRRSVFFLDARRNKDNIPNIEIDKKSSEYLQRIVGNLKHTREEELNESLRLIYLFLEKHPNIFLDDVFRRELISALEERTKRIDNENLKKYFEKLIREIENFKKSR